jgi:membrane associated rhomboid family serine protease
MGTNIMLFNIPVLTVFKLNVWRIFTSFFTNMGLINFLFSGLMVWYVSNTTEAQEGTGRTILKYIYYHLVIQVIYTVFCVVVLGMMFGVYKVFSSGIWPVYFVFMTMTLMANPEGFTRFCCFPCPIKNKFYPLLMLGLFMILGSALGILDVLFGYLLGLALSRSEHFR